MDFPPEIRRIIYTTNAIESLNSSLRKLVGAGSVWYDDMVIAKSRVGCIQ